VRACAGAGKLPELPRPARQHQRVSAEGVTAAAVRRMSWLRPLRGVQRPKGRGVVRKVLPELPYRRPRKQQSVGSVAPAVAVRCTYGMASLLPFYKGFAAGVTAASTTRQAQT